MPGYPAATRFTCTGRFACTSRLTVAPSGTTIRFRITGSAGAPVSPRIAEPGQVLVSDGERESALEARNILLSTGSRELVLPGIEIDGRRVLTSRQALEKRELPESIVIVGGGAVGLEFAYTYAVYGVQVTIVEMMDQLLPGLDRELAEALAKSFTRRGVKIATSTTYRGLEVNDQGVVVTVEGEKGEQELRMDQLLLAVGRRARVEDIGLEQAGVQVENGFVAVGEDYRTAAPGIWAIGDVIGPPLLAHKASEEGKAAVEFMAGQRKKRVDPKTIPACIYCQPQVASFGLTEAQAVERRHKVKVGRSPFRANGKALGLGDYDGFVKIVADATSGEILGAHLVGPEVTELLPELVLAHNWELTPEEIARTVHAHPTLSEVLMEAAHGVFGEAIHI